MEAVWPMGRFLPVCWGWLMALAIAWSLPACSGQTLDPTSLYDLEHVIEVEIELEPAQWRELCQQAPNAAPFFGGDTSVSNYSWFTANVKIDGISVSKVGIRKKGFLGSNDNTRPSLKLKFDKFEDQHPLDDLNDLTLNNNKQDQSQVSQLLTYQLFRDAGLPAPRSNFAHVSVNGRDLGIYTNVEPIKEPFLQRNFGSAEGALYEIAITDLHPKTLDKLDAKNKAAKDLTRMNQLAELLAEETLDIERLETLVDLDSFFKFWAIESLTGFWDGYTANQNNAYIYVNPATGKACFIPWGADWVFSAGGPFRGFGPTQTTPVYTQSILANRLYHAPGMAQRYRKVMDELLASAWNEDRLLELAEKAATVLADFEMDRSVEQRSSEIKKFIRERRQEVVDAFESGEFMVADQPRTPMYATEVGSLEVTVAGVWGESTEMSAVQAQPKLKLDGKEIAIQKVDVQIREFSFPGFGGPGGGFGGGPPRGGFGGFGGFGGGRPAGQEPPAMEPPVMMTLTLAAKDTNYSLNLMLDSQQFHAGKKMDVSGAFSEVNPGGAPAGFGGFGPFGGGNGKMANGSLKLTENGSEEGQPVVGKLKLQINQTKGGMFGGGPPGGRRGGGRRGGGFGGGFGNGGGGAGGRNQAPNDRPNNPRSSQRQDNRPQDSDP